MPDYEVDYEASFSVDYQPTFLIPEAMLKRLEEDFTFHPVKEGQAERYQAIRDACLDLARMVCHLSPASREQSLALTAIEQVSFYANAAIARHE